MKVCKNLIPILIILLSGIGIFAQKSVKVKNFEQDLEKYVDTQMSNYEEIKALHLTDHDYEHMDDLSEEDIKGMIRHRLKAEFIIKNQKRYLDTYFHDSKSVSTSEELICDNGGFEDDFLYYDGFTSTYKYGSNTCFPVDASRNPSVFIPVTMPLTNGMEIVTSGIDPMIGIQKTKFGNKALKINSEFSHNSPNICIPNLGVDRVTKSFKVTEDMRDVTIWYAVAIENPGGHVDQQPYLNISCDRDPDNELCFDADLLRCDSIYDNQCWSHKIDVLDWTCHRFKIPEKFVDSIATLTMEIGDCGQSGHFGYAYFDGICEECTGSSLGTNLLGKNFDGEAIEIDYRSCYGTTARVCGVYESPVICGTWEVGDVKVPGMDIENVSIDTATNTYCFDFSISNFGNKECLDIYTQVLFQDSTFQLPFQLSNDLEICKSLFSSNVVYAVAGSCNTNGTEQNLSDDYYYVDVFLSNTENGSWTMSRKLENPYIGETGLHAIESGMGDGIVTIGPFLVQEGPWELIITVDGCTYGEYIDPPVCDVPCSALADYTISNVRCKEGNWFFDIIFHTDDDGEISMDGQLFGFQEKITINGGSVFDECKTFSLTYNPLTAPCNVQITVCPPKPCNEKDRPACDLNVYIKDVYNCDPVQGNFDVEFDISYSEGNTAKKLCYSLDGGTTWSTTSQGYPSITYSNGGQTVFKVCDAAVDCKECVSDCMKIINIPDFDCTDKDIQNPKKRSASSEGARKSEYMVFPQPFTDILYVVSEQDEVPYTIRNIHGVSVARGILYKGKNTIEVSQPTGVYILSIAEDTGARQNHKIIKQ